MRLLRAEFQNFRLLRDLEIKFSAAVDRKLTVVRAANESGKTTILHALQWALYGDTALPGKGENFRLHPIDWEAREGKRVPITATIEFEESTYRRVSGLIQESRSRYYLVRTAFEEVDNHQVRRSASTVKLFAMNRNGASPIEPPDSWIKDLWPPNLREVFFTDGDRALSFIEADVARSTKRRRVQGAIQSLLGLTVINNAIKHVQMSATNINKKAKRIGGSSDLSRVVSRLVAIDDECNSLEAGLKGARQQFAAFDEKLSEINRQISAALQKGDKEKLDNDLNRTRIEIRRLEAQLRSAKNDHSNLFRGRAIARDLLAPVLGQALAKLETLHDQGKIPNTTIPVLQERLKAEVCICGETLAPSDRDGQKRRAYIQRLIDDSQRADKTQVIITSLYYSARPLHSRVRAESSTWIKEFTEVSSRRDKLKMLLKRAGRMLRALELKVDSLKNTDIRGLRTTQRHYKDQRDRYLWKQSSIETQLAGLRRERKELAAERQRLLRVKKKGARILAELQITQDVRQVLQGAYEQITIKELQKVSNLMNTIFLEMIGADPEQGAIIRRTEISREFDILVYGPNDRSLNPDRDLNGASRRALTLAFILALTKISEVEAPNVIDTPLGMTSGYVKRSILRTLARESTQLVLFLTHDEIIGCEEILDQTAGNIVTLTNPAHYPIMLLNDPSVAERKVLRCECDHRSECQLCARRADSLV